MWTSAGLENGPIPALSSGSSVGLLAAHPAGVFRSVDGGQSWELTACPSPARALMVDGENRLFALSGPGIFRSSGLGESWTLVYDGTSESSPFFGRPQYALALGTDETLYAGTADGVLRSAAGGDSWSPVNTGLGATWIHALASHPNDLAVFAGTAGSGLFTAAAFGEGLPQGGTGGGPWASAGLANGHIHALGVQHSTQAGIESGNKGTVFAGTYGLHSRSYESQPPPWSSNAGAPWIPVSDDLNFVRVNAVHITSDGLIFAGTQTGVYRFLTGSWEASGLADSPISAFAEHPNGDLFAGSWEGLFRSPDNGDTWESFGLEGMVINALAINADGEVVAGTSLEGVFRSPPDAPAFSAQNEGLTVTEGSGNTIHALVATLDGQLFAGHLGGGVFRSIDGGDTWEAVSEGLTHTDIRALILATDGHLYAGSFGGGVFRSVEPQGPAPLPDLLVSGANFLGPFLPGQQGVRVVLEFQNQVPDTATQNLNQFGFDVRVEVMTPDGEIFQVIEEFKNSSLNSGVVTGFEFFFDLPGGGPQGAYKVVATIDPEEVIEEADETNNTLVASFEVASKPPFSNGAIAFASNRNGPTLDIYTMTADGSGPTQLTNALGNDYTPDWSRNGKQIAFMSQRDPNDEIYVMDIDGENEIQVTENTTEDSSPSWSPDGERIAFLAQSEFLDGNGEIYAINVDGTGAVNLTDHPANDVQPDWSPDGERIAFSSNRDGGLYVFLMDADGGNVTNLTGSLGLPGQQSAWSPDGEQIALSSGGGIVVVDPDGGQGSVVVYESPKFADSLVGSPTWSPDGQWIAFAAYKDGDDEIYAVSLKGNVLVKLTENSFKDVDPSWSPSPLPDLAWKGELEVVGEDGDPPPFDLGELITFTGTIVNQGAGLAEGFAVEALLTGPPDGTAYFGPGLILSGLTLAVGEEIAFQHSFQLPSQAPGGNYQLTAILDPDNVVGEADEIAATLPVPAAKRVALAQERGSTIGANNSIVRGFEVSGPPTEGESTDDIGPIHMDFDLSNGDQTDRVFWGASPGAVVELQLVLEDAPLINGWSVTIEFDPTVASYVTGSFQPSDFISGFVALVDEKEASVGLGGTVLGTNGRNLGGAVLATVSFELLESFADETELAVTSLTLKPVDGESEKPEVRAVARITSDPEIAILQGDFDQSGAVDFEDFFVFADAFGGTDPTVDLNGDGIVDFDDFFIFADNFGQESRAKLIELAQDLLGLPRVPYLEQNYPNPFNPETTIRFDLPQSQQIELAIYNLAAQRVATLVQGRREAGSYFVRWDGVSDAGVELASGVYFYRLRAGERVETRKLLLLR